MRNARSDGTSGSGGRTKRRVYVAAARRRATAGHSHVARPRYHRADDSDRSRERRERPLAFVRGKTTIRAELPANVAERTSARQNKDYARGDAIRDELAALGIAVKDGPQGTEWSIDQ